MNKKSYWDNYFPIINNRNKERLDYLISLKGPMKPEYKIIYDGIIESLGDEYLSYLTSIYAGRSSASMYIVDLNFYLPQDSTYSDRCTIRINDKYIAILLYSKGVSSECFSFDKNNEINKEENIFKLLELTKINILNILNKNNNE